VIEFARKKRHYFRKIEFQFVEFHVFVMFAPAGVPHTQHVSLVPTTRDKKAKNLFFFLLFFFVRRRGVFVLSSQRTVRPKSTMQANLRERGEGRKERVDGGDSDEEETES
jgi:hypothetical protein